MAYATFYQWRGYTVFGTDEGHVLATKKDLPRGKLRIVPVRTRTFTASYPPALKGESSRSYELTYEIESFKIPIEEDVVTVRALYLPHERTWYFRYAYVEVNAL